MKKVYNIGIYQKGKYDTVKDKKAYTVWKNMIQRCYDEKTQRKFPSYIGCVVCDEWLYFQIFAEWFYQNYIEGYTLDKDLLGNGKLYSPNTCCFLPNYLNNIFHTNNHNDNGLPTGVKIQDGKYRVQINSKGRKKIHIGYFNTKEEAFESYKKAKIEIITNAVNSYDLSDKITSALINKINNENLQ